MSSDFQSKLKKSLGEEIARVEQFRNKIKLMRLSGLIVAVAAVGYGIFAGFSVLPWLGILVGVILLVVAQIKEADFAKQLRP